MSRPRIRTFKPEIFADEKFGTLSRDARNLFFGLVSMADDEGRLRAMPAAVLGHVFPYDDDASRKLSRWVREVEQSGMVLCYEHQGTPYLAFRHWRRHQQINKARPSDLPPPPDAGVVRANAVPGNGVLPEPSGSNPGGVREDSYSHAGAGAPEDRNGSGSGTQTPLPPKGEWPTPPSPPVGKRKRDIDDYEQHLADYTAWLLPTEIEVADPVEQVRSAISWAASHGGATNDRVLEVVLRSHVAGAVNGTLTAEQRALISELGSKVVSINRKAQEAA